jgi:hypothetical protein
MTASVFVPVWIIGAGGLGILILSLITNGGTSSMGARSDADLRPRL